MLPSDPGPAASTEAGRAAPEWSASSPERSFSPPPGVPVEPVGGWQVGAPPPQPLAPASRTSSPVLALAVLIVAIMAGGALFMSGFLVGRRAVDQPGTPADRAAVFAPFWDTYDTITRRFAGGEVTDDALVVGAIRGMVEALGDPYSSYLTAEEYRQGLEDLSGEFEGIGAEIGTRGADGATSDCSTLGPECLLVIVSPLEGSPAEKAGLLPGDAIVAVDGSSLDGLSVDQARDKVRGKKGTEVRLTIVRDDGEPFEVPVVRDVIVAREVIDEDLGADGGIGYVRVTGFSDNAAARVRTVLEEDLADGRTRFILDLRGNPGGYVTAARDIASEFLADGPLFWEEIADGTQEETSAKEGGVATDPDLQVVVLVDGGSASASEIVAGALQDRGRATIVGQTTFGKGTVQQWIDLDDGAALKLTIAKWLTPDQRWIHGVGIVPDVDVTSPDDVPADADPTLDRAVELLD